MVVKLRKAIKGDEKAILELVKEVLLYYGLNINPDSTDKDISDLNAYYFENNGWFSVLEEDGKIVGSYGVFKIDESQCELRKMYILQKYQGHGFGKLMLEDAFAKARALGYHEMFLETNQSLKKAIGLYKSYGFKEVTNQHFSDRCDLAMTRPLY